MSDKKNPFRVMITIDPNINPELSYLASLEQRGHRGFEILRLLSLGVRYEALLQEQVKTSAETLAKRPTRQPVNHQQPSTSTPEQEQVERREQARADSTSTQERKHVETPHQPPASTQKQEHVETPQQPPASTQKQEHVERREQAKQVVNHAQTVTSTQGQEQSLKPQPAAQPPVDSTQRSQLNTPPVAQPPPAVMPQRTSPSQNEETKRKIGNFVSEGE